MGYVVKEKTLRMKNFDVEASCARGYLGTASALPCTPDSQMYQLKGCQTDTRTCKAPSSTPGYSISEHDLVVSTFDVSATCAKDWILAPGLTDVKVDPCTADQALYRLSGCFPKKFCVAPDTTGYVVDEKQLLVSHFEVEASCAPGYTGKPAVSACGDEGKAYVVAGCALDTNPCTSPGNTLGYKIREYDLIKSKFNVDAAC